MTTSDNDASAVGWTALRDRAPDAELLALVESRSQASLDAGELVDLLAALKRLTIRCEALGLAAADTLRRQLHAADPDVEADHGGDPTDYAAVEVAGALAETKYRSRCRLHLVRQLSTELPRVWELVCAGRLDVYSADQIHTELQAVCDRSLIPELEAKIVAGLLDCTAAEAARASGFGLVGINPTRTRKLVRRLVAAAEPDATDEKFRRAYAERAVRTDADDTAGMGRLWLSHSIDRITAIGHRLTMIARSLPAEDPRTMDQRVADLACDILEGRISVDTCTSLLEDGEPARIRRSGLKRSIQVNLTVPIQTAMGLSNTPGETLAGAVVPASLARQLAADPDSVWYRMLTDAGRFVELSTDAYTPTAAQKRSGRARDRTCVGVGCNHPADSCDLDHTWAWTTGGRTRDGNLGLACRAHHNSKDNGGPFGLAQPEPGLFWWTYPSGHTYTTTAEPYPESDWPATTAQEFRIPATGDVDDDPDRDIIEQHPDVPTEILESWAPSSLDSMAA